MTNIGTVIDGKYEILKEIGRGGMSIVYLAMDKRLNKQWAVKEIRKRGNGKNDEIVVNSLLAEANLMKRLDHAALPRIVDIIDNGVTIYVVMDYIEGESLDKILAAEGPQPEDKVIEWAKQLCDALGYLHSQKKPIIYRDMKPANVMLKPEGNIKIIDFGIAREYKEQNLADTTVLGTKGYAPPEQYSGQTDPRSDIFALGMTMHHLLTGVDPRNGEPYAPVRQWNPDLSEGIEAIIDKCVQPAAENRYQSCSELMYDLEHPELIGRDWRRRQQKKVRRFGIVAGLAVLFAIVGVVCSLVATGINNRDYELLVGSNDLEKYKAAVELFPSRLAAYEKMVEYFDTVANDASSNEIKKLKNLIDDQNVKGDLGNGGFENDPERIAKLNYSMGKMILSYSSSGDEYPFPLRNADSHDFFDRAIPNLTGFEKEMATCYESLTNIFSKVTNRSSTTAEKYEEIFNQVRSLIYYLQSEDTIAEASKNEKTSEDFEYDTTCFYYYAFCFISDQTNYIMRADKTENGTLMENAEDLMKELYKSVTGVYPANDETPNDYIPTKRQDGVDYFVAMMRNSRPKLESTQDVFNSAKGKNGGGGNK